MDSNRSADPPPHQTPVTQHQQASTSSQAITQTPSVTTSSVRLSPITSQQNGIRLLESNTSNGNIHEDTSENNKSDEANKVANINPELECEDAPISPSTYAHHKPPAYNQIIEEDLSSLQTVPQAELFYNNYINMPSIAPVTSGSAFLNSVYFNLDAPSYWIPNSARQSNNNGSDPLEAQPHSKKIKLNSGAETVAIPPMDDRNIRRKRKGRCHHCGKRVGLVGFPCRCGGIYCGLHRYSDQHDCSFDYISEGRDEVERNNPRVVSSKVPKM